MFSLLRDFDNFKYLSGNLTFLVFFFFLFLSFFPPLFLDRNNLTRLIANGGLKRANASFNARRDSRKCQFQLRVSVGVKVVCIKMCQIKLLF